MIECQRLGCANTNSLFQNCFLLSLRHQDEGPQFRGPKLEASESARAQRKPRDPHAHTCEHVSFHMCLKARGARLGILPSLLQGCGGEHMHPEVPKLHRYLLHANGSLVQLPQIGPSFFGGAGGSTWHPFVALLTALGLGKLFG